MKGTIIYYGGFALPDKNAAANRVVSNGKLFNSLGLTTVFLGADYENSSSGITKISDNMYSEPHPTTTKEWLENILLFKNLKNLVQKKQNVTMINLYNVPFVTLVLAKKYFSKTGIEVAYDCTEWTKYTEGSFLKRLFKYADEFFVRNFAHKVADRMLVISNTMAKKYATHKKLLKLPPLVDINDEIWHQKVEKNKENFTFCFAGFPGGNKESLDKVVEAFQLMNAENAMLNVVGLTLEDFQVLYPDTKILNTDRIKFGGKQSHIDTVKNILNCDCYIFIRSSDKRNNAGFPTKFAESFTCGVPIITTNVSDIKEYIVFSEDSVLIDDCDLKSIENAMRSVFEKDKVREKRELKTNFYFKEYIEKTRVWVE